jgi:hypothetical protein
LSKGDIKGAYEEEPLWEEAFVLREVWQDRVQEFKHIYFNSSFSSWREVVDRDLGSWCCSTGLFDLSRRVKFPESLKLGLQISNWGSTKFQQPSSVKHCQFPSFLGQQHTTANMEAIFDKFPNVVTTFFAAIGFVFLGSKVIGYIQLLLSLFVLSGKNVRSLNTHNPSIT